MEAAGIEPASSSSEGVSSHQVTQSQSTLAAVWQRNSCANCRELALSDTVETPASVQFIAERWHLLPPHIREAVLTLVDVATSTEGGGA